MKPEKSGLKKEAFGPDFKWGISTAAYQIEGGHNAHGKGLSIWDVFTAKGSCHERQHGNDACDFYNRYKDDIALVKALNIPNFRFSLSWPRIIPNGTGEINPEGIAYYNRLIDECLANGIEPWVTLYHWDLPHELELKGGWANREIIGWFTEYVRVCAEAFGDRVKHWMVMNEPLAFTGAGYFLGIHAPGKRGLGNFLPAVHNAVLATAAGGRMLKSLLPDAEAGTTFSCSYIQPKTESPKDALAAQRVDAVLNRLFIEPLLGLGYPETDLPVLKKLKKYMQEGDEQLMAFTFDFIGIQNYTREVVKHSVITPYVNAMIVDAKKRRVPLTAMGWEVYPKAIYHMIKKFNGYEGIPKIYITENGAAFPDTVIDGKIIDNERCTYIQEHLKQVKKAKDNGLEVSGYFVWTLTDNFEWHEGYRPRFGLIHVDFETQQRTVKASGRWYGKFLGGD